MDKLLFKRILISILVVCMVSYVIYHFVGLTTRSKIETETVEFTTVSDIITTEAFIVRDEVLLDNNSEGVISYRVSDGDNIKAGQNIADVYNDEKDAVTRRQIEKLNKQIKSLVDLSNSYNTEGVGIDTVNTQIENKIISYLDFVNSGEYSSANNESDDLLFYINERQVLTGQIDNFNKKIKRLRNEKSALETSYSQKIDTIKSPVAGYFVTEADGYESNFKYEDVSKITIDDYDGISHAEYTDSYAGKIVTDPEWYVVCKIDKDDCLFLSNLQGKGIKVKLRIPFITTKEIPAEIIAVNLNTNDDKGILVLSCDYMNKDISKARIENVEIETASHYGLKISKRAICDDYVSKTVEKDGKSVEKKKKVQGVFVLHGSEIVFKEIDITYSSKNYVICNPEPDEGVLFNGETLSLYDHVIIKGDNLYDGKIVS